jgi:hemerythrin
MGLAWREQLSVGNDVIDDDHKHLIEIINQVENNLLSKNRRALNVALDELTRYSETHFVSEEKIATAVGYSHVARIHDSHAMLLTRLSEVRQEIGEEWTEESVGHFTTLLRDWLIKHVIKEDLLMKPFLTKFSPRFDPR